MSDTRIGIKLANGEFYPILADGEAAAKRLVVTTVSDEQPSVQIDLYRGMGPVVENASYIGSLVIENISPMPKGDPDIALELRLDGEGNLTVTGSEETSGESQKLSVSLTALSNEQTYEIPDFEFEDAGTPVSDSGLESFSREAGPDGNPFETMGDEEAAPGVLSDEDLYGTLTGSKPVSSPAAGSRPRLPWIILFVVAGLILALVFSFLVYRCATGTPAAAAKPAATTPAPAATTPAPAATTPAPAATTPAPVQGATPPTTPVVPPKQNPGVWYKIKWGDTLWDLAYVFYRDPWLYPRIAKANKLKNPNRIIAGASIFIPPR
ncbi:MAG: Hsp70 family protein [Spirochaetes bacterium]|nr:Hsp70 family protein [Spirochaetota bacterium]